MKVEKAVERLNAVLPLKQRQAMVGKQLTEVHKSTLRSFVERGRILNKKEIAQMVDDLPAAIKILKENDMIVFDCSDEPVGAYPFTMEERAHKLSVNGNQIHAMCALDALGVSPMFGHDVEIHSECKVTGAPIAIKQRNQEILNRGEAGDIHFGIIWNAADSGCCCANSLCTEMIFLKDGRTAEEWHAADPGNREIFALDEAVDFAAKFFVPLVED